MEIIRSFVEVLISDSHWIISPKVDQQKRSHGPMENDIILALDITIFHGKMVHLAECLEIHRSSMTFQVQNNSCRTVTVYMDSHGSRIFHLGKIYHQCQSQTIHVWNIYQHIPHK